MNWFRTVNFGAIICFVRPNGSGNIIPQKTTVLYIKNFLGRSETSLGVLLEHESWSIFVFVK